jgi:hypothetical protein
VLPRRVRRGSDLNFPAKDKVELSSPLTYFALKCFLAFIHISSTRTAPSGAPFASFFEFALPSVEIARLIVHFAAIVV